ncbi:MAG: PD40 domain-containing protein [Verrucomicrobia bacterium]|nr:PD40 domain-containing protein [Verrucomicrobiota bacterium]
MPGIGQQPRFKFGAFELDTHSGELRKRGIKVRLQPQPIQTLSILLENAGQVVTREEMQKRLWPDSTYVDFDNAINSAIRKLRDALGDNAENPVFVETLARRGYRFIYPIPAANAPAMPQVEQKKPLPKQRRLPRGAVAAIGAGVLAAAALAFWMANRTGENVGIPSPAVPLTSYLGLQQNPSFSPDGTRVAFAWYQPAKRVSGIYVKSIGPGDPVALTTGEKGDFAPAWSPDGQFIAFMRPRDAGHSAVMIMPSLGGQERHLTDLAFSAGVPPYNHEWSVGSPLTWSPNGKWLIGLESSGPTQPLRAIRISVGTGEKRMITSGPQDFEGDGCIALSPDGKILAFSRADIYTLPMSDDMLPIGELRRLTFEGKTIDGLAWTADGHALVFVSSRSGKLEMWRMAPVPKSSPVRINAAGPDPSEIVISRERNRLIYTHWWGKGSIQGMSLTGRTAGQTTTLISSSRDEVHPKYSPDGKRMAFESNRSGNEEVWISDVNGSNSRQLTYFGAWSGSPRWSPDGRKIAFDSDKNGRWDIYVVDSEGGEPVLLTTSSSNAKPSWSHDGKWIYFTSDRSGSHQIWKIPASGGKPIQLTRKGGMVAYESADGKSIYYALGFDLWEVPVNGGEEVKVLNSIYGWNFAPGKQGVYFLDGNQFAVDLKLLDVRTRRIQTIAGIPGPVEEEMTISPDEQWMAYAKVEYGGSELMLIENFH